MAKTSNYRSGMNGGPRRAADVISAAVAAAFTVPIGELHHRSRRRAPVALARQSAMYLAHVTLGLTFAEVGRVFGPPRPTRAEELKTGGRTSGLIVPWPNWNRPSGVMSARRAEPGLEQAN